MRRAALTLIAFLALTASAPAAVVQVTGDEETGLGDAILEAAPGDTIQIPPGTFLLTQGATLEEKDLLLAGAGTDRTTIIPTGGGDALDDEGVSVKELEVGPALEASEDEAAVATDDDSGTIETKAQIIALIVTFGIFLFVLDLVRRRKLAERYALLWMTAAFALLVLSIWTGGLDALADLMGIQEPANAIFILAFGLGFLLLLNFSVASSRLSEETKVLAQEVARLDQELRLERALRGGEQSAFSGRAATPEQDQDDPPVRREQPPQ